MAAYLGKERAISTVFLVSAYRAHRGHFAQFADGWRKTMALLLAAGKRVVLVYPVPTAEASVPRTLARYAASGTSLDAFHIDKQQYLADNADAFRLLNSFTEGNILRVYPHERLCPGDVCVVQAGGTPLYYDNQHPSVPGAAYLEPLFESAFDSAPAIAESRPVAWRPRYRGSRDLQPMP